MMIRPDRIDGHPVLRTDHKCDHWVFILLPIFDEANRLRRTAVEMMRHLAMMGVGSGLPDLPSQGENDFYVHDLDWKYLSECAAQLAASACPDGAQLHVASFRNAALFDHQIKAQSHWRLSPQNLPDLRRSMCHNTQDNHIFGDHFLQSMEDKTCPHRQRLRSVFLASEGVAGAPCVTGPPIWLWAEPGDAPQLTTALAEDLHRWVTTCVSS